MLYGFSFVRKPFTQVKQHLLLHFLVLFQALGPPRHPQAHHRRPESGQHGLSCNATHHIHHQPKAVLGQREPWRLV